LVSRLINFSFISSDSSLTELSAYACDLFPELRTVKYHQGMLKLADRFYFPVEKGDGGNIMFQKPCNDDFVSNLGVST